MITVCLLLFSGLDPCAADTSKWHVLRHGPEEIRYSRADGFLYLALRNIGLRPTHVDVVWRELGFRGSARVFDITANKDEGKVHAGFAKKLPPGACAAYRLLPPPN